MNPLNPGVKENNVILENCAYGSLHGLSVFTKPYEEVTAYVVLRQVTIALQNVHREHILHLDVKESNILINFNKEN